MSIFNTNPDPDYPVNSGPGFIQHTCNYGQIAQQQQPTFYYNGQQVMPGYQQQPATFFGQQPDSRRYDAPQTPQMPAPMMMQPQQSFGFNQLVEDSRRNQPPVQPMMPPQPQQSAWGVQPTSQVPQIAYQQPMPVIQEQAYIPSMNPNYSALYTLHPSFDKKHGVWGNTELMTPIPQPTVSWGAAPSVIPSNVPQYGQMNSMAYPSQVQPQTQTNWEQIARTNFQNV